MIEVDPAQRSPWSGPFTGIAERSNVTGSVDWFVEHRLPDGGWSCE